MQTLRSVARPLVTSSWCPLGVTSLRLQQPPPIVDQKSPFFHHRVGDEYDPKVRGLRRPRIKVLSDAVKRVPDVSKQFARQAADKFMANPILWLNHGDYEVLYKFDTKELINSFILTTDRIMLEGRSQAEFVLGPNKTGIFRGYLNTTVPKDGVIKRTGYCNIKSPVKTEYVFQEPHDLTLFTHLLFRVRGDGRPYQLQLSLDRYFDLNWQDQHVYTLFTRGGPYWQHAYIPLSKFFLTSKGRIQDQQEALQRDKITHIGITLGDDAPGAFQLEIDYITAVHDERHEHEEEFPYEMYGVSQTCMS